MSRQIWWYFQGTAWNVKKAFAASKQPKNNGGGLVMGAVTGFYLRLQTSESREADELGHVYKLTKKQVAPPSDYGIAPCGNWWVKPRRHSRNCPTCQRLKHNAGTENGLVVPKVGLYGLTTEDRDLVWNVAVEEALANEAAELSTGSEEAGITGQAGHPNTLGKDDQPDLPQDFFLRKRSQPMAAGLGHFSVEEIGQASYAATAEAAVLMEAAIYWEDIAAQCQALLEPTPAIVEAQKALDAAQANVEAERTKQYANLQETLKKAPAKREWLTHWKGVMPGVLRALRQRQTA